MVRRLDYYVLVFIRMTGQYRIFRSYYIMKQNNTRIREAIWRPMNVKVCTRGES